MNTSLETLIESERENGRFPSLSVAVTRRSTLLHAKAYGLANLEHSVPATPHTVYRIGSLTKTFTAAAVMLLVEHGKVQLADSIRKYLPDLSFTWDTITLRHLLAHTSGVPSYEPLAIDTWRQNDTYEKLIQAVAERPLCFQPGEAWGYDNTNYVVLGLVIERVSGKRYAAFLEESFFAPLGMVDTRCNDYAALVPNRAQGYVYSPDEQPCLENRENPHPQILWNYADGGMLSTAVDLAIWDSALSAGTVLTRTSIDQMWTPARLNDGRAIEYGIGWILKGSGGQRTIGHWGRIPGFTAEMTRFPADERTVVVLSNRWTSGAHAELEEIVKRIAGFSFHGRRSVNV